MSSVLINHEEVIAVTIFFDLNSYLKLVFNDGFIRQSLYINVNQYHSRF